ncbi:MAG: UPF0175 family protein [Candidatus Omnitrophica bacterium]|nr:UPF0175 family protein [Candidatus Omnitrophota bacterium]
MRTLAIDYPDSLLSALNLSPSVFESEARMALAVKFYEIGRLTSSQAAKMAGFPRVVFLVNCPKYGAASVRWDGEEIGSEIDI